MRQLYEVNSVAPTDDLTSASSCSDGDDGVSCLCVVSRLSTVDHKKSMSTDDLAAAAADGDVDTRRLPASPFRDMENDEDAQFVAGVEEMRVSPVISRRGYLYFLEESAAGWNKLWVVSSLLNLIIADTKCRRSLIAARVAYLLAICRPSSLGLHVYIMLSLLLLPQPRWLCFRRCLSVC